MHKLIREFLEYIELERGHSQLTIRNYEAYLSKFADFAKENGVEDVDKIDLEIIKKWRLELHRRSMQNKTLNYYMIALRSFLKYCSKMDIKSLVPEKIELSDTPDRVITFLEPDELGRILKAFNGPNEIELRNRAIIEFLFSTGLRVSELTGLNRDQINLERGEFAISGKGGKRRIIFVSDDAKKHLEAYLKTRHDSDRAVFTKARDSIKARGIGREAVVSSQSQDKNQKQETESSDSESLPTTNNRLPTNYAETGLRLTSRQIERIVAEGAKRAGIVKQVTPHTIRHSFATDLLRGGADIRSVQDFLGHASITTTQIYTHVSDKHLRETYDRFHNKSKDDIPEEKEGKNTPVEND